MGQSDLPVASGERHARAFERAGLQPLGRRGRGKHFLLQKPGSQHVISVPDHREVKRALIASQLKLAGISIQDYVSRYFK